MSVEGARGVMLPEVEPAPSEVEAEPRAIDWRVLVRRWAPRVVPPLVYLAMAFYATRDFWSDPQHRVFGTGDAILFSWYFQWVLHCIVHLQNPFVSSAMAAPYGVNVMWNTAVLVLAFVFSPLTATIGATATVGVLESLSLALCAITAYFVLRRLTGRSLGAALGACLYGFGPFFVNHTGHLHLVFAVFPPLAVLVGYQLIVKQDKSPIRTGLLLGLLVGLQMLISEELLVLTAIGILCALIAALVSCPPSLIRAKIQHAVIGLGVGAGLALVILAVPLYFQFFGPNRLRNGFRVSPNVRADLASFVRPGPPMYYRTRGDLLAFRHYPTGSENTGFLGWPLIVLAFGFAVWLMIRRSRFALWWLVTTLGVMVLSMGSPVTYLGRRISPGPWAVLRKLPLLDGAAEVRLSLITLLMFAGLIAVGLARFRGWQLAVAAVVVALALVPLRPVTPYRATTLPPTPAFFTSSAVNTIPANSNVLMLPYASYAEVRPMLWQIHAGLRFNIVGGYSVFSREGTPSYWPPVPPVARLFDSFKRSRAPATPEERSAGLASLRQANIRYILITSVVEEHAQAVQAAADLTGCTIRPVKDVLLCEVPPS